MRYSASIDKTTKIITVGLTALFVGISVFEFLTFSAEATIGAFVSTAILIAVYCSAYIYRPVGYSLTEETLIVHRPISDVAYSLQTLDSVQIVTKEQLKFTIRTFGVGGFWGYFGRFYNSVYGKMIWYVTRRDQLVLIKTDNKTILLSPDDISSFTLRLKSFVPIVG